MENDVYLIREKNIIQNRNKLFYGQSSMNSPLQHEDAANLTIQAVRRPSLAFV